MAFDAIGPQSFISVIGNLPRFAKVDQDITREGEDGDTFRNMGLHSDPKVAVLHTVIDPLSADHATQLMDFFDTARQQVFQITQFGSMQPGDYLIRRVTETRRQQSGFASSGGVYNGGWILECDWEVTRVG